MGRAFYLEFLKAYGPTVANECAMRLPHRCQAGRWSSIFETERFYLKCGRHRLKPSIGRVLNPWGADAAGAAEPVAHDAHIGLEAIIRSVEDPTVESHDRYRKTMGRWRADVLQVSQYDVFYNLIIIHNKVIGVVEHFMSFLSQVPSMDVLATKGGKVCQLVTGRAQAFLDEYAIILGAPSWMDPVLDECTLAESDDFLMLIVELTLHHAAAFHRRVKLETDERDP